jgi:hypothetical protein
VALLPALLATVGIAASIVSSLWCETIKIVPSTREAPYTKNITERVRDIFSSNSEDTFGTLRFGLFYYSKMEDFTLETNGDTILKVTRQCVKYESQVMVDTAWKIARVSAIIAPIAAGVLTVNLYMAPCCILYARTTWSTLAFFFILVIPGLQCLTLLFLTSKACTRNNPVVTRQINALLPSLHSLTSAPTTDTTAASGIDLIEPWQFDTNNPNYAETEKALRSIYNAPGCQRDWGYYASVVSMMLFCAAGICMMTMGAPTPPTNAQALQTANYHKAAGERRDPVGEDVDTKALK